MQTEGVVPDTLVGLMLLWCSDLIVGMLGILRAGGAYVPIDPGYPEERVRFIVEDAGLDTAWAQAQAPPPASIPGLALPLCTKSK